MQTHGFCCDSFTILQRPSDIRRDSAVVLRHIDSTVILLLLNFLEQAMPGRIEKWNRLQDATDNFLALALPGLMAALDFDVLEEDEVMKRTSLALQVLSMGLLSYTRGHASPIEPFFLDTVIHNVVFLGSRHIHRWSAAPQISARLTGLTCMSRLTGGSVLTFGSHGGHTHTPPLDLTAYPADVIDTWGPARLVKGKDWSDPNRVLSIEIGDGILSLSSKSASALHWQELSSNEGSMDALVDRGTFSLYDERRIGLVDINGACPLAQPGNQENAVHACSEYLHPLGTTRSGWYPKSFQTGLTAGKHLTVNVGVGFEKRDGRTVKTVMLGKFGNPKPESCLGYLEAY